MTQEITNVYWEDVEVKQDLPPKGREIDTTLIAMGAVYASHDFMPVHHDPEYARAQGAPDIFMNILTTNGYVSRYVTDWAGPRARLRRIDIRLGGPCVPGKILHFSGRVSNDDVVGDDENAIRLEREGACRRAAAREPVAGGEPLLKTLGGREVPAPLDIRRPVFGRAQRLSPCRVPCRAKKGSLRHPAVDRAQEEARVIANSARAIEMRRNTEADLEKSSGALVAYSDYLAENVGDSQRLGRYIKPAELRLYLDDFLGRRSGSHACNCSTRINGRSATTG